MVSNQEDFTSPIEDISPTMVLFNLKVLAKLGLCSNCSRKIDKDECSLAWVSQFP